MLGNAGVGKSTLANMLRSPAFPPFHSGNSALPLTQKFAPSNFPPWFVADTPGFEPLYSLNEEANEIASEIEAAIRVRRRIQVLFCDYSDWWSEGADSTHAMC